MVTSLLIWPFLLARPAARRAQPREESAKRTALAAIDSQKSELAVLSLTERFKKSCTPLLLAIRGEDRSCGAALEEMARRLLMLPAIAQHCDGIGDPTSIRIVDHPIMKSVGAA